MHANLTPRGSNYIRYEAISGLSPWHCCLLYSNDSTMKTQEAAWRASGQRSMPPCLTISWVMSLLIPFSRPKPPLSLQQAVKSLSPTNVSECSVIQGRLAAVDKYWKCYPSLKHHSFTYCKSASLWAPVPALLTGRNKTPGSPSYDRASSITTTEIIVFKIKITREDRLCVWMGFSLCKIWSCVSHHSRNKKKKKLKKAFL